MQGPISRRGPEGLGVAGAVGCSTMDMTGVSVDLFNFGLFKRLCECRIQLTLKSHVVAHKPLVLEVERWRAGKVVHVSLEEVLQFVLSKTQLRSDLVQPLLCELPLGSSLRLAIQEIELI